MKKRIIKICILTMCIFMICSCFVYIHADFWSDATNWKNNSSAMEDIINDTSNNIFAQISDMINVIGTSVIVLVTIALGTKYMFGSVDSKADVKESLINLLVACVFFFGWQSIKAILIPGNNFVFTSSGDFNGTVGAIFSTSMYILQFLVIVGVIYVGVRYIFSGASGRGELKAKSGNFLIGIILAFATTNFLTFLSKIINQMI
ncbi:MAG: hypothetical protein RSD14_03505 [Clostridia bacterium]